MENRLVTGGVAAVAGIVIGLGAVLLGGVVATETKPATDLNSIPPEDGFVQGAVEYGSRSAAEAD